jgi:hypothetical protein
MKKQIIIFTFLLFTTFSFAQTTEVKGNIITTSGKKEVTFVFPFYPRTDELKLNKMMTNIQYLDSLGKTRTIKPKDVIEIDFNYQNTFIRMVSIKNIKDKFVFLHLITNGFCRVFKSYSRLTIPTGYNHVVTIRQNSYFLQKKGGSLVAFNRSEYKTQLKEFFSDCPELCSKIDNKEYKSSNFLAIVKFYNTSCN